VLAGLLAYLLLAERLTAWQVAGGGLILGGAILIQLAGAPKAAQKTAGREEIP